MGLEVELGRGEGGICLDSGRDWVQSFLWEPRGDFGDGESGPGVTRWGHQLCKTRPVAQSLVPSLQTTGL